MSKVWQQYFLYKLNRKHNTTQKTLWKKVRKSIKWSSEKGFFQTIKGFLQQKKIIIWVCSFIMYNKKDTFSLPSLPLFVKALHLFRSFFYPKRNLIKTKSSKWNLNFKILFTKRVGTKAGFHLSMRHKASESFAKLQHEKLHLFLFI